MGVEFVRILGKEIDMLAKFNQEGIPTPIKFRITGKNGEDVAIRVDQVLNRHLEKLAGNKMLVFKCQSVINGKEVNYDLKYGLDTMKWMMFKIY
jgi:hypothetical protein